MALLRVPPKGNPYRNASNVAQTRRAGPRVPPKGNPYRNASNAAQSVWRNLASRRKATPTTRQRKRHKPYGTASRPAERQHLPQGNERDTNRMALPRVPPKGNPYRNASNAAQTVGRGLASRRDVNDRYSIN